MRKIIASLVFLLVLGACQNGLKFFSGDSDELATEENEILTAQGEIAENQRKSGGGASFLLKDPSGRTLFFLESAFEDLSRYLDRGTVEVKGEKESLSESPIALLRVQTVQILEAEDPDSRSFSFAKFGIVLELPASWSVRETAQKIEFFSDLERQNEVAVLEKLTKESVEGKSFAAEMSAGTEISVGGKRAFRFVRSPEKTDIFLPLKNELMRFQFNGNESEKSEFYDLLLSVRFPEGESTTGVPSQICGGIAGFACPQGYRCELSGSYPDASGICVLAVNPPQPEQNPAPATEGTGTERSAQGAEGTIMAFLRQNLSTLVPEGAPPGSVWKILSFSFSPEALVAVEYAASEDAAEKRKILFSYTLSGSEVAVKEEAYFRPGEESDWELESGQNLQRDKIQEVFSEEGEKTGTISEGYRRYESAHYNFSVEYPKNFYYASADKKVLFSDQPVSSENALLSVEIVDGRQEGPVELNLEILLPRDETSHFRLRALQSEHISELEHMASSLIFKP